MDEEESKEEQEILFEEELRKSQDGECSDESDEEYEEICRRCQRIMSRMRKTGVRWLYLEWYKKAVLGQTLPTVSLNIFPFILISVRDCL